MPQKDLFSKRLIFVTGKGGAGKTAISTGLSITASRMGKKVLLAGVDHPPGLRALTRKKIDGGVPTEIRPGIWGVKVDPDTELYEYIHRYVPVSFLAHRITDSRLFDHLSQATPGLKEVMTLGRIFRWERESDPAMGFDLIIVDAPATGHGMGLLQVPTTLVDMLRGGPIARQTRQIQDMLRDERKTALVVVTLPEALPVNETVTFLASAREILGMPVTSVIANAVYPERFTPEEMEKIFRSAERLKNKGKRPGGRTGERLSESDPHDPLIRAAVREIKRRRNHESYLEKLNKAAPNRVLEIPYYFTNILNETHLRDMSDRLGGI